MGRKKIIKEDEGTKHPVKIERVSEGTQKVITVTRTTLNLSGAKALSAGDIISHTRVMKIVSITHKDDGSAEAELEIIKRNWSQTPF